jgi:hypothetical protein
MTVDLETDSLRMDNRNMGLQFSLFISASNGTEWGLALR